jgi:hypothetical protein
MSEHMNYIQKFRALEVLSECSLKLANDDTWYVEQNLHIKEPGTSTLLSVTGYGKTLEEAINDHWDQVLALKSGQYLVAREYFGETQTRRITVRWNKFMWEHVTETVDDSVLNTTGG